MVLLTTAKSTCSAPETGAALRRLASVRAESADEQATSLEAQDAEALPRLSQSGAALDVPYLRSAVLRTLLLVEGWGNGELRCMSTRFFGWTMKRITKAQKAAVIAGRARFDQAVSEIGAVATGKTTYGYEVQTYVGKVRFDFNDSPTYGGVYACFDDPELASTLLGKVYGGRLNTYSGKWNFHSEDSSAAVEQFLRELRPLIENSAQVRREPMILAE